MSVIQQLLTDHIDIWTAADTGKKSGRGRASSNAGSVYGIRKLRELILELAVRGKLVPQDGNDEPASELLKRIQAEKAALIAEGKIRKHKLLPLITEEEKPFAPPKGWNWVRLGDVLLKITDGTHRSPPNISKGDFKYISAKNIKSWGIDLSEITYVTKDVHDEIYGRCDPVFGDILYIKDGATTGVATTNTLDEPFSMLSSVALLKPSVGTDNQFLLKAMTSPFFYAEMRSEMTGVAITRVTLAKLNDAIIPLPPLAEQHRIVAKVDELMALCDQLETQHSDAADAHEQLVSHLLGTLTHSQSAADFSANWQRIAAHFDTLFTTEASIDTLKKTLLQLAVMGTLVPQDVDDEPASELLKRIQAEKMKLIAEGKIKKDKPLGAIAKTELPFNLPLGWSCVRFGEYVNDIATGPFGSMIHQSDYIQGGVPIINPSHMIDDKIIADESISVSQTMAKTLDSYSIYAGDIVMARRGEVGRIALVTENERGWLCGTGSFVLRFFSEIPRNYIRVFFKCDYVRKYLSGEAVGTTMVNLNHGILRKMPIGLPPLAEQHRIVTKVDELMELCDQLKVRINEAGQLRQKVADVLVEQAVA